MVLFVLCSGVEFLCCLNLMYVFIALVKFGLLFGTYWEIAAHSALDMFYKYKYLIGPTSFFFFFFLVGISL